MGEPGHGTLHGGTSEWTRVHGVSEAAVNWGTSGYVEQSAGEPVGMWSREPVGTWSRLLIGVCGAGCWGTSG